MEKKDKQKQRYRIQRLDEKQPDETQEPDRLPEDPLDQLPDVTSQTAGLPVVTFVLLCLAGFVVMLIRRAAAGDVLVVACCVVAIAIALFGIVALVRGMFEKLRKQNSNPIWYRISGFVMAAGIVVGIVCGIYGTF